MPAVLESTFHPRFKVLRPPKCPAEPSIRMQSRVLNSKYPLGHPFTYTPVLRSIIEPAVDTENINRSRCILVNHITNSKVIWETCQYVGSLDASIKGVSQISLPKKCRVQVSGCSCPFSRRYLVNFRPK